jgi:predicted lipid-binding transport protein (Tim44 family)
MQAPQRSGWGGMLGGLLVGGLIGSLLFGGMGGGLGGLGGGIGLMEIVLIGGLIVFAIMWMRRRQAAIQRNIARLTLGSPPDAGFPHLAPSV